MTMCEKCVLIVDDSAMIRKMMTQELTKRGYRCESVGTLAETLKVLREREYDLIILDLNLPDAEGIELIRSVTDVTETKVIIYTGDRDFKQKERAFQFGILDYYVKDKAVLKTVIEIDALMQKLDKNRDSTVLVIDDSAVVRTMMQIYLEMRNYNVLAAATGKEGIETLNASDVDLLILDLQLPDIHGTEVLSRVKSLDTHADLPVLVVSGAEKSEVMGQVYKLGASDFLHKPFVQEEFLLKVDFWIDYYRKNSELARERKLLNDYKEVVDRSNIVSKTDAKGRITYVNDAFCDISKFSREELIGQPHNIIRHPDMPAEAFKEMWETIMAKKPWSGIVKNRAKDGSAYYVDTVINPIIDNDGRIVEYIGVRRDVTEQENAKNRMLNELKVTAESYEDAKLLSEQYEKAINESNILSRTSPKGKILYANDEFYRVTGYTADEVIGNNHKLFRHPDTPKEVLKNMWETIASGRIWKGLIKNRRKDGSPYWVDSVILPILDKSGKIVEYMAIRHDVTEILNLHTEIEETQRELIYRMGEAAESRSKETGNHIKRVALYSRLLAEKAGLSAEDAELIFTASPMHDIGKIAVPDSILKKPGPLDDEEWDVMRRHCEIGFNILDNSERPILKAAAIVANEHHEKYNGKGYPRGLKGEDIHIFGRISAIADVFDALGSDRCYKKAWELDRIIALFEEERGEHFDPMLTDLFLDSIDEFVAIRESYKDVFDT